MPRSHRLVPLRSRPPAGRLAVLALALALSSACAGSGAAAGGAPVATKPPYKVTVAGDSISVGLGAQLRTVTPAEVVVKVIGVEGTGLARPDTFDWPGRLRELARDFPPQVLVLSLASNDAQDLRDDTGNVVAPFSNSAAWEAEYTRRLGATFDAFADSDTTVLWVGHLRTRDDRIGAVNRRVHELATEVASGRDRIVVTDLAEMLGSGEEVATRCLTEDGVHLTVPCLDEAARKIEAALPDSG